MSVLLTVNEQNFLYPERGDKNWGQQATAWATTLTALVSNLRGATAPIATSGVIRLGNNDRINWREGANAFDVGLRVNASNRLLFFDGITDIDLLLVAAGNVQGPVGSTDNAVARFDGLTGQAIQNSLVTLSDLGSFTGVNLLNTVDFSTPGDVVIPGTLNVQTLLQIAGVAISDLFIDVIGSSTDNALVRWDGATGKQVQNSAVTVSDLGGITIPDAVVITGTTGHSVSEEFANEVIEEYARPVGTAPGVRGVAISSPDVTFSTNSHSYVALAMGVVAVSTGRPIRVALLPGGAGGVSSYLRLKANADGVTFMEMYLRFLRDGSPIAETVWRFENFAAASFADCEFDWAPAFEFIDTPGAGSWTYTIEIKNNNDAPGPVADDPECGAVNLRMVAYEL